MWSAYIFISLLCFKPHLGRPQVQNLGNEISENGQQRNLVANIEEKVEKSLSPADAATIRNDMANGIGGTTIATYSGEIPRTFIINNRSRSICKGTIKGSLCEGTVEPFVITVREDYCYATSYATVYDDICLSSRGVKLILKNSKFECTSGDSTPTLVLTRQEYQDLCNKVTSRQIAYKYYANATDPAAIAIPNPNTNVICRNNEPGVCEFEENKAIPGTISRNENDISNKNTATVDTTSTNKNGDNANGCNILFQRMELILFFAVTASVLFQY